MNQIIPKGKHENQELGLKEKCIEEYTLICIIPLLYYVSTRGFSILTQYIGKAMSKVVYDKLEDGSFPGKIPQCPGVITFGENVVSMPAGIKIFS